MISRICFSASFDVLRRQVLLLGGDDLDEFRLRHAG